MAGLSRWAAGVARANRGTASGWLMPLCGLVLAGLWLWVGSQAPQDRRLAQGEGRVVTLGQDARIVARQRFGSVIDTPLGRASAANTKPKDGQRYAVADGRAARIGGHAWVFGALVGVAGLALLVPSVTLLVCTLRVAGRSPGGLSPG